MSDVGRVRPKSSNGIDGGGVSDEREGNLNEKEEGRCQHPRY